MALCESCETSVSSSPASCAKCGSALGIGRPVKSQTVSEQVLLDQSGVFVSNCRVVSAGKTYAMSGVTSISVLVKTPSKLGPLIVMALGAVIAIISRIDNSVVHGNFGLLLGIGIFLLGLLVLLMTKSIHAVLIHSSSGETQTFPSKDEALIQKIVDALNQAIIIRG